MKKKEMIKNYWLDIHRHKLLNKHGVDILKHFKLTLSQYANISYEGKVDLLEKYLKLKKIK